MSKLKFYTCLLQVRFAISTYLTNLIKHFDNECQHDRYDIVDKVVMADYSKDRIIAFFDDFVDYCKDYDVIHIQNELVYLMALLV